MRRPHARTLAAAFLLVPLASTCTPPAAIKASAREHPDPSSEDQLLSFLIDGSPLAE